ncbi:MAG: SDR family oxidoreductase [Proteobacteria bacterium]|nr:SDR family oxidoreductase [Pseudomonadota bacterium]MBU2227734.1 SDR family oxidoreductase [Pseudomonadota bacterium]MBU2262072.1 SDR family oxidoreductase [Pseudomonadota bacterium]
MHEDLNGKTAVVTGAGKKTGIGYAVAERLASCGCNVVIADLGRPPEVETPVRTGTREEMDAIASELGKRFGVLVLAVEADVTDPASIARMAEILRERCGHIHILVNNAGASFGVPADILSYDEAAWIRTIDVCLLSVFRVSRAVLPLMLGEPGAIVNTASRAGKVPPLFNSAYAAAKAGVIMLTRTMAKELAGRGIRVNAICPGQIRTDLEQWRFGLEASFYGSTIEAREEEMCRTIPLGRIGDPGDAGMLVAFLASEASRYITGQAINLDGGQCMEL